MRAFRYGTRSFRNFALASIGALAPAHAQQSWPMRTVRIIEPSWKGFDIGPESIQRFRDVILRSSTIFWNGPMGMFEKEFFAPGTQGVAEAIATATGAGAQTILGGGDTIAAINEFGLASEYSYVSAAGGASLEFLAGKELPGVKILQQS